MGNAQPDDSFSFFLSWCKKNGLDFQKISVANFGSQGRGILALDHIRSGEVILCVPQSMHMTLASATDSLGMSLDGFRLDDALALHILNEKRLGTDSQWAPHIAVQPETYSNSWFFDAEELSELSGTTALQYTERVKQTAVQDLMELKQSEALPSELKDFVDLKNYMWALSTVWSRGFDLEVPGTNGRVRSLVPLADMFNSTYETACTHRFNASTGCLEFVAQREYEKGDQVFINYGAFNNEKWLRVYGFAILDNPFDHLDFFIGGLDPNDQLIALKKQCLDRFEINPESAFPLKPSGAFNEDLITALSVKLSVDRDHIVSFMVNEKNHPEMRKYTCTALLVHLRQQLDAYPTTLAEDRSIVESPGFEGQSLNKRNAVFTRLGEKTILEHCIRQLEAILAQA